MDIEDESNDFCQECGTILELPLQNEYIECIACSFKMKVSDYKSIEIVSVKEFKEKKEWLKDY